MHSGSDAGCSPGRRSSHRLHCSARTSSVGWCFSWRSRFLAAESKYHLWCRAGQEGARLHSGSIPAASTLCRMPCASRWVCSADRREAPSRARFGCRLVCSRKNWARRVIVTAAPEMGAAGGIVATLVVRPFGTPRSCRWACLGGLFAGGRAPYCALGRKNIDEGVLAPSPGAVSLSCAAAVLYRYILLLSWFIATGLPAVRMDKGLDQWV